MEVQTLLDIFQAAAVANDAEYLLAENERAVNDLTNRSYPCIVVIPPDTIADANNPARHTVTIFALFDHHAIERVDATFGTGDSQHSKYKIIDDLIYDWRKSVLQNDFNQVIHDVGTHTINRLAPNQHNDQLIGARCTFTFYASWYCRDYDATGRECSAVTVTDGDDTQTVAAGGSYTCSKAYTLTIKFPIGVDEAEDFEWPRSATFTAESTDGASTFTYGGSPFSNPLSVTGGDTITIARSDSAAAETLTLTGTYA